MKDIGMFPLNLVLFPGSQFPLHIFEEKYINLINECWLKNLEFGVNYSDENGIQDIGCLAKVTKVWNTTSEGSFDIIVVGTEKYLLDSEFKNVNDEIFYRADIKLVKDYSFEVDQYLLSTTKNLFSTLLDSIKFENLEDKLFAKEWIANANSYLFATKSGLSSNQKLELLKMGSENERLEYLIDHLKMIIPGIKKNESIKMIHLNDGYLVMDNK
ncbi:MAG: LON peptidase substrate-binding domain-containing protein [Chlorobiota bacterium]|nr:LON peptidase substrate-binding domain-containing protein [Chlorobiota bacterium]QQS65566.1 MAG: LON peptidase substrate-binding domain-containing protein [Chlorobiota bacterium]